jgi:hypothetical protein
MSLAGLEGGDEGSHWTRGGVCPGLDPNSERSFAFVSCPVSEAWEEDYGPIGMRVSAQVCSSVEAGATRPMASATRILGGMRLTRRICLRLWRGMSGPFWPCPGTVGAEAGTDSRFQTWSSAK